MVKPILEARNTNDICVYALVSLTHSTYLEPQKSMIF